MNPYSNHQNLFLTPRSPAGRIARKHLRASEDKKPLPTIAGNNVPSTLQPEITPARADEIVNPSPQPALSAQPKPSLKDMEYPQKQPPQQPAAPGAAQPPLNSASQPGLTPDQAGKMMNQVPPKGLIDKVLDMQPKIGKWKVTPKPNGVEFGRNF